MNIVSSEACESTIMACMKHAHDPSEPSANLKCRSYTPSNSNTFSALPTVTVASRSPKTQGRNTYSILNRSHLRKKPKPPASPFHSPPKQRKPTEKQGRLEPYPRAAADDRETAGFVNLLRLPE
ncbi:unnamed protein product [Sphenostylis stenocarpa]|uniref:Uncharacterized protein n=1 Tax=Sphenostylis stenocarpa TaxID=92480 RepID=A0AA86V5V5_9FABA|nr:unnamed protein product [Sphenostylis stenocarpa]